MRTRAKPGIDGVHLLGMHALSMLPAGLSLGLCLLELLDTRRTDTAARIADRPRNVRPAACAIHRVKLVVLGEVVRRRAHLSYSYSGRNKRARRVCLKSWGAIYLARLRLRGEGIPDRPETPRYLLVGATSASHPIASLALTSLTQLDRTGNASGARM